jgi:hypothetical protein
MYISKMGHQTPLIYKPRRESQYAKQKRPTHAVLDAREESIP